jgi:hypothetical protein
MKQRSRRAGGSNLERPRLAGKGRPYPNRNLGATRRVSCHYDARTLSRDAYGLAMSLVESRRENGKVRHEHLASLGSIETPLSGATRIEFWRRLHERLDQLSNRLTPRRGARSWTRCILASP